MTSYKEKLKDIDTLIFDFDGVLTDGMVLLMKNEFVRNLNSKDSFAIQHAAKMGFRLFVITGGNSEVAKERLTALGIKDVVLNATNKLEEFKSLSKTHGIDPNKTLYMGDDLPDIPLLQYVGLSSCPQDAVNEVKSVCDYISAVYGGKGAVRDVVEQVLKVNGKWMTEESYEW